MFTISNENMDGTRKDRQGAAEPENAFLSMTGGEASSPRNSDMPSDATQRVYIDPHPIPPRRSDAAVSRQNTNRPASASNKPNGDRNSKKRSRAKNKKITIITLFAIAAVLLISIIATLCIMLASPEDDGLILNNVYAAGVNLGGKTPEQAKQALSDATSNTYTKLDMVVEVHTSEVILSPDQTGAKLDIDAVVQEAYNYGRTGSRSDRQKAKNQSLTSSHVISILPYLNLSNDYIQDAVDELGNQYSSTLSQPSYRLEGIRPDLNTQPEEIDIDKAYQTLYITLGTAEYGLDTEKLYDQIMEAYNSNLFQVVGEISVVSPETLDLDALYKELCIPPVDAVLDEDTYEVTPEAYGYGFHIDEVRALVENAKYGDEIQVPMTFHRPKVTEAELKDGLFESELAFHSIPASDDKNLLINLKLACRAIDGLILKADEVFDFNDIVGMPTQAKGFKEVTTFVGKVPQEVVGGGISQVASTLYYCALKADLEILERTNHIYAPDFIEAGLDADVHYGTTNFRFKNTTNRPIRIDATVTDAGALQISIWGTGNEEYTVEIIYETVTTYKPATLTNIMLADNPDGYRNGDVLVQPITGYDICTYKVYRYADSNNEPVKQLIAFSHYDKQDTVVVEIQKEPVQQPTNPSEPTPSDPTQESTGSTQNSSSTPTENSREET